MKIADMHCDTISEIWQERREGGMIGLRQNGRHVDLQRMKESGYLLGAVTTRGSRSADYIKLIQRR